MPWGPGYDPEPESYDPKRPPRESERLIVGGLVTSIAAQPEPYPKLDHPVYRSCWLIRHADKVLGVGWKGESNAPTWSAIPRKEWPAW
jgi:hypothetical protein